MKRFAFIICVVLSILPRLYGQLVADGATNTLSNLTNVIPNSVIVGTNGSFTLLILSSNTLVTNSPHLVIGANTAAKSNELQLISPTARWLVSNNLYVGSNGAAARLVVSNGAFMNNNNGLVGNGAASSNNLSLVTGGGSLWSNRIDLTVGVSAPDNQLIVSNGARVVSRVGNLGQQPGSSNNLVVVTGNGSSWTNHSDVNVGASERGNRLLVEAGGFVGGDSGRVGAGFGSQGEVLVVGAGSLWDSRADLAVGFNSANNLMVVSNGAAVVAGNNGRLGAVTGATNNVVLVTGAGSLWSNQFELYVGEAGPRNRMEVNGGGRVMSSNTYVGFQSTNNFAMVTGSGSLWSNRANFSVGLSSSGNQFVASAAGQVLVGREAVVGGNSNAVANSVIVDGVGTWLITSNLYVGSNSSFNRLIITNGGKVRSDWLGVAGQNIASKSNEISVIGPGSIWFGDLTAYVGLSGSGNRMAISSGGQVNCTYGAVGANDAGSNNLAVVTGLGSLWNSSRDLWVGVSGSGNRLVVTNGGGAFSETGSLGVNVTRSNEVTITDPGSFWSYGDEMRVGRLGSGNILVVSNGAWVGGVDGSIGEFSIASNNLAVVTGTNSAWTNLFNFRVGSDGSNNRLLVENGGRIANDAAFIGVFGGRNQALVSGAGTLWTTVAELVIGDQSTNNLLTVSNGAVVLNTEGAVGNFFNASNNLAVVTGAGSVWSNADTLYVGHFGSRNQLIVSNSGSVFAGTNLFLGESPITGGNRIAVSGGTLQVTNASVSARFDIRRGTNVFNTGLIDADRLVMTNALGKFEFNGGTLITRGAFIRNGNNFVIGDSGTNRAVWNVRAGLSNTFLDETIIIGGGTSFNELILTNGNLLTNSGFADVGRDFGANSNRAVVAGVGSQWLLGDGLIVGRLGFGNRLLAGNGAALVTASFSYIGFELASSNNEAVVTGPGTTWTSGLINRLHVGYRGRDNRLFVTDGGHVDNEIGIIGSELTSSNNLTVIAGPGSLWSNHSELRVGDAGSYNRLQVTNGGLVTVGTSLLLGNLNTSSNNHVIVDGGILRITNPLATAALDIRRGTNVFNAGLIEVDRLLRNNSQGFFEFNGGTLSVKETDVVNGQAFRVGNGVTPATLLLTSNGFHAFGPAGLTVSANGILAGNGNIGGAVAVQTGGLVSPGVSIGRLFLQSFMPFTLQGGIQIQMELSKNGSFLTNDVIQKTGMLTYAGTLTVSNLGPTSLAAGDNFQLFVASIYAGSFSSISLPPLPGSLTWTNKLLVDGSIEVVSIAQPVFGSIALSGTNLIFTGTNGVAGANYAVLTATNVAEPLNNWLSLVTNQFGDGGQFSFTNGLNPKEPQRFFHLRTP